MSLNVKILENELKELEPSETQEEASINLVNAYVNYVKFADIPYANMTFAKESMIAKLNTLSMDNEKEDNIEIITEAFEMFWQTIDFSPCEIIDKFTGAMLGSMLEKIFEEIKEENLIEIAEAIHKVTTYQKMKVPAVWDAELNQPVLDILDETKSGYTYYVINEGIQFGFEFVVGDWVIYDELGNLSKNVKGFIGLNFTEENVR